MIRGFTKKGKLFLEFDTNLAEKIKNMYEYLKKSLKYIYWLIINKKNSCRHVMGAYLLVSGKNVFNLFEDCQDIGYYVSDDEINSVLALPSDRVRFIIAGLVSY